VDRTGFLYPQRWPQHRRNPSPFLIPAAIRGAARVDLSIPTIILRTLLITIALAAALPVCGALAALSVRCWV
jgi:hypothetical protein